MTNENFEKNEPVDFDKMKKELIEIYEEFLKNPSDDKVQNKISVYEKEFGGLQVYNDYLKSNPIPKEIELGLSGLSTIYQYDMWEDDNEDYSNEKIISRAKKILEGLRKY